MFLEDYGSSSLPGPDVYKSPCLPETTRNIAFFLTTFDLQSESQNINFFVLGRFFIKLNFPFGRMLSE